MFPPWIRAGQRAVVVGLVARADLNGSTGVISKRCSWNEGDGRVTIAVSEGLISLKPANLMVAAVEQDPVPPNLYNPHESSVRDDDFRTSSMAAEAEVSDSPGRDGVDPDDTGPPDGTPETESGEEESGEEGGEEARTQHERRLCAVALRTIADAEVLLRKARAAASDPSVPGGVAKAFRDTVVVLKAGSSRLEQTEQAHVRSERTRAAQRKRRGSGPSHRHKSHTGTREKVPKPKERDKRKKRGDAEAEVERKQRTLCPHVAKLGGCKPRGETSCRFAHSVRERDSNHKAQRSASAGHGKGRKRSSTEAPDSTAHRGTKRGRGR
jgi:hypothetical protein